MTADDHLPTPAPPVGHATSPPDVPDPRYQALAQCAAELCDAPFAAISLVGAPHETLVALHGDVRLSPEDLPPSVSFCRSTLASGGFFEVDDAARDARFFQHPWVLQAPHARAYAGVALRIEGRGDGTLWVLNTQARRLTPTQRQSLESLARLAATLLGAAHAPVSGHDDERARLGDFARASGDWMWETDEHLRYTWVSSTFESATGTSPGTVRGQTLGDAPLLDGLGQTQDPGCTLHTLLARRQPITRVITDKLTPRGVMQVSRSAVPVFTPTGRFSGYRGTARDVSAHIAAERRHHAQSELLRKLSSQVPGVIFQLWLKPDGSTDDLYASDAVREMFGIEPPPTGSQGQGDVCRQLHPDDEPTFMPSLVEASRQLTAWRHEFRIVRNGRVRWIEANAAPERHPNGGTVWHGYSADVTVRKETELALRSSEERWGLAAEAAGIGIAELDLASGQLTLDARACANHGLPHPHPPYQLSHWLGAIHPDDRDTVQARLEQAVVSGGMFETRYRHHRPDGSVSTLEIFARCSLDDARRPLRMVGACRDVTQQVAHEQLHHDKEAAERASRAKSEFLSRVSHELRTPLNGILGFAQLMALDHHHPLAPDQSRRIDSVMRAGRHLLELINDMLNLARIEQEDFSLQRTPVNLATVLETCFTLTQPMADSAGIRLSAPVWEAHWVVADTRAVEQVLLNLLSNAIKYNRPQGAVQVQLSLQDGQMQVAVSDEGDGLNDEQQARLFQPFDRLGAEQRRVEGTGLGLVIARQLATAMGGSLDVRSTPGQGSTFTLRLPAGTAPRETPPRTPRHEPRLTEVSSAPRSVLYIEDEPLNVLLMQEVFRARPQWELNIAEDGQGGLAAARLRQHDLLLIDMNLPDTNGLALIHELRADPRTARLRCIALSADAMQAQIDTALAAGFDGYWTKPFNVGQMLDGLAQALEH